MSKERNAKGVSDRCDFGGAPSSTALHAASVPASSPLHYINVYVTVA